MMPPGGRQVDLNGLMAEVRRLRDAVQRQDARASNAEQSLQQLQATLAQFRMESVGGKAPNITHVEDIPGRRIPFDFLVDIPIPANLTTTVQGTLTVTQEGPYVCVARCATFMSALEFSRVDPESGDRARFFGRSFGRFRPTDSARDQLDGLTGTTHGISLIPPPGSGLPLIASPSNQSPFRTMEFDARIVFQNAGSSFPRSNQPVPSTFYSRGIAGDPWELAALDVFERGEVVTWQVAPTHQNNPAFGNLSGFAAGGVYPFLDSQFDAVEGINDTIDPAAGTVDPIRRLPNGILTIGFHGYKIIQPAGPGPGAY